MNRLKYRQFFNVETSLTQEIRGLIDESAIDFLIEMERMGINLIPRFREIATFFTPEDSNDAIYLDMLREIDGVLNSSRMSQAFENLNPTVRVIFDITLEDFRAEFGEPFRSVIVNAASDITNTERSFREMPRVTNLAGAFVDILRNNTINRKSVNSVVNYLEGYLPDMFGNFFGQRVVNNYESFSREILRRFANNFNLVWAFYAGPQDDLNREFCAERVNEFWHRAEIESWSELTWDGKFAGTNSMNIFERLGGYNCRHKLVWVKAEQVPESRKNEFRMRQQEAVI